MEKEKMLVTKALNELKLLDERIRKEIMNSSFVATAKIVEKKVTPNCTKDEFNAKAKATFQSINDLMDRRARIKAAVVASNAVTKLQINGTEMTVAEAIELKTSITYQVQLLNTMTAQLNNARKESVKNNLAME